MTKKTKPKKTMNGKKPSLDKVDKNESLKSKAKTRGRPKKINSTTATDKNKKSAVETPKSVRKGRKPKVKQDSEVEIKVREIVKKTQASKSISEEKKESSTFNLDDVRAIIKKRKVEISSKKSSSKKIQSPTNVLKKEPKKKTKSTKVKKLQTASIDDILGFGGDLSATRPIRDETKVPSEWKSYYKDLMSLRNSLKGALGARSNETLGASARESSGELSINSSDSGTEAFNRDVALSMVASEQEALEEIEDAIDRIFDGSFGVCQETNKPIKKNRLKVVPFTRFSLEGQTLYEKRKQKNLDNGGGIFATISDSTMGQED